jgi:hypothetical protein
MGLAKSLVANLGLQGKLWWLNLKDNRSDQIERTDGTPKQTRDPSKHETQANTRPKQTRDPSPLGLNSKTFEEWRALAGCFFLSVMYG